MRLIYVSTDEMNQALVRAWAGREAVNVDCPGRLDRSMTGTNAAILLDMDHLPSGWFEAILTRLGASGEMPAVAAHGYGPNGDELRGRGLTVHRRLNSQMVMDIASAAVSSDSALVQDNCDALTWVDLV